MGPGPFGRGPLGAEEDETELLDPLLVLDPEKLPDARLRTGLHPRDRPQGGPGPEQGDGLGLGQQRPDLVEDDGVLGPGPAVEGAQHGLDPEPEAGPRG